MGFLTPPTKYSPLTLQISKLELTCYYELIYSSHGTNEETTALHTKPKKVMTNIEKSFLKIPHCPRSLLKSTRFQHDKHASD